MAAAGCLAQDLALQGVVLNQASCGQMGLTSRGPAPPESGDHCWALLAGWVTLWRCSGDTIWMALNPCHFWGTLWRPAQGCPQGPPE